METLDLFYKSIEQENCYNLYNVDDTRDFEFHDHFY